MKERIIVWGIGSGFYKRREFLEEAYEIVAFTGNQVPDKRKYLQIDFIEPSELSRWSYDKIIVCSIPYYETIKYQLINIYNVKLEKIVCVSELECNSNKIPEDIEKVIFSTVKQYKESNKNPEFDVNPADMWLICDDYEKDAGSVSRHYFAQDIWAANKVFKSGAKEHFDIGSRLDGFIAHVLSFCEKVNYIDIRPLPDNIEHLCFIQGDATNLESIQNNSISSLSSLHAIEHFGLGRYADPIDAEACFKAMKAFQRVLQVGGRLYLGVPVGPENKVVFNAHRIFHPMTVINQFSELQLLEFSYVEGANVVNVPLNQIERVSSRLEADTCGLFEFSKSSNAEVL